MSAVLVQRIFTTQSGGSIGKSIHPNGAYRLAGLGHHCSFATIAAIAILLAESSPDMCLFL